MVSVRLSRDETIETLTKCLEHVACPCEAKGCYLADQHDCKHQLLGNVLELLKEQEEHKRKWLRNIADNQLANAPKDRKEFMSLDEHMEYQYQLGVYDGLQMAWDILTEDDNVQESEKDAR